MTRWSAVAGGHVRRNLVGYLALFIALGGTGYAASLPRNSVGAKQLKTGAVTSRAVRDGALTAKDFKRSALTAATAGLPGPQGPAGPTGATGPQGPAGAEGVTVRTVTAEGRLGTAGGYYTATARCGPGEVAISGGYGGPGYVHPITSGPHVPNAAGLRDGEMSEWTVGVVTTSNAHSSEKLFATALCARWRP